MSSAMTQPYHLNNKLEHMSKQNNHLKEQIMIICTKIEETIENSKNNAKGNEIVTEEMSVATEDYMPIHMRINKYKENIAALKAKMEGLYNLRKIENMENEIKSKKELVYNLKYENNVLSNIQKNQNKAQIQYEQKFENKNEVKLLQEKLRTLKEEYKYSKDLQKKTEAKIKSQNGMILALEEKCGKIKESIEHKKRAGTSNTQNTQNKEHVNPEEDNHIYLEEKLRSTELLSANEERKYKTEVGSQQALIAKLSEELSIINLQLKEKEQEIRINELKLKEIKKINKHSNDIAYARQMNKNKSDNRAISAKMKGKEVNAHNRSQSKPLMSKTPVDIRKPFNIKFDNHGATNYTEISNNRGPSGLSLPMIKRSEKVDVEKEEMLNQIENLKNELKNALKYNEALFKNKLENDAYLNENQIFANHYNYNTKDQSSMISNKELFEKIDNSMINEEVKENNSNYNTEDKRKPFKLFLFANNN